jgi:hypothetical protein
VKRAGLVVVVSLLPVLVLAQVSPNDFARGADIHAEGGSIFQLLLPDDVYATVTRADLGDVRVLNAAGDVVPHTLRRAPLPAAPSAEWRAVASFPMSDVQTGASGRTQVKVDASGAVLEVTTDSVRQATTAYLVDVTAIDDPLTRLALSWDAPAGVTFLARVNVQGSNDLDTWRTLVSSAAVAQLQRDALTLTQSEIELPATIERSRYLRISWPKELSAVTLTSVRVRPRATAAQAEIRWQTLTAEPGLPERLGGVPHTEPSGAVVYDARGLFPVEYIDLDFADASDAVSITVRSRPAPSSPGLPQRLGGVAPWQIRHTGLFYSLQEANGAIRSAPARIASVADRYWSLERGGGAAWTIARAPRLKIGWHPHELVFVAQGPAPYLLAYGSARVAAADAPLDALLRSLDEAERARQVRAAAVGSPRSLGGAAALAPPPPLRRVLLWTILATAVALLAWLAIRTFRDTSTPSHEEHGDHKG